MNKNTETTTIPADIAKLIAERMRADLDQAAKTASDYRTKAHNARKSGEKTRISEYAVDCFKHAEHLDSKADRWDAEFNALERICVALTRAGA